MTEDNEPEFVKPTIEQTAWVVMNIMQAIDERETFRDLIYGLMGYEYDAYFTLLDAGLMRLTNAGGQILKHEQRHREQEGSNT